jgi:hypothetical protein
LVLLSILARFASCREFANDGSPAVVWRRHVLHDLQIWELVDRIRRLYGDFNLVSIRVKDDAFIVAIAGDAGLADYPITICFQPLGQPINLLSGSDGKGQMRVSHQPAGCPVSVNIGGLHEFKSWAGCKRQKVGFEVGFGIRVFWASPGGKMDSVKAFLGFQLACPDGDVFDLHHQRSANYF